MGNEQQLMPGITGGKDQVSWESGLVGVDGHPRCCQGQLVLDDCSPFGSKRSFNQDEWSDERRPLCS